MKVKWLELVDSNGVTWRGQSCPADQWTVQDQEALEDMLSNFRTLDHLSLEIDGVTRWFNPAHVVTVTVREYGA